MCDEDVVRFRDRQADMQDATSAGNTHELVRLCPRGGQHSGPVVQEFPFCRRKCDPVPPSGQSSNCFVALTENNPMEEEDPQIAQVDEPPRLRLRLMFQVLDIMADQQVSGSDTESIDGASEGEMPVVMLLTRACRVLLCLDQSLDEG